MTYKVSSGTLNLCLLTHCNHLLVNIVLKLMTRMLLLVLQHLPYSAGVTETKSGPCQTYLTVTVACLTNFLRH